MDGLDGSSEGMEVGPVVEPDRYVTSGRTRKSPDPLPITGSFDIPEKFLYRVKNKFLGPPLVNDQLKSERLGKPTALAVLSSDVMSSSAYATEELLTVLIPVIGVAAFSLVLPITLVILVVLAFVTMSYLQVIKAFPKAGGAYVVTREVFGIKLAQLAAAALLIDYTLTVAVSVAAGVDALTSAVPSLVSYHVEIAVAFVAILAYGNLRGIREAGKSFAVPTFLFIINMGILIGMGLIRAALGHLPSHSLHQSGAVPIGHAGGGLFLGASLFWVLTAFANGGTALTGTEAISNGVSIFRTPQSKNARKTLVAMSIILGTMFSGISILAVLTHAVPMTLGSPTVVSQIASYVYGSSTLGRFFYFILQASTMLILVLAANTSFTGFPFLASYAAADSFLPRKFTQRGHRLVLSFGILALTLVSEILLIAKQANVNSLIALYAIGVFTGFTMAGVGMVKYHITRRETGWKLKAAINGSAALLSFLVDGIFAVTKFREGAWIVIVLMAIMVVVLIRLHAQYVKEEEKLEDGVVAACEAPVLRHHSVLVFVDSLDVASAKSLQYARTLTPDQLRAVHFTLDEKKARELETDWKARGLGGIELEIIECPDRRLRRAALELVAEVQADGDTEVTVLLPRRVYSRFWGPILHDGTADEIAKVISQLPHAVATIIPYEVARSERNTVRRLRRVVEDGTGEEKSDAGKTRKPDWFVPDAIPIGEVKYREPAKIAGRIKSVRVQSWDSIPSVAVRVEDSTGGILLVFAGRKEVPGIANGRRVSAQGTVGELGGHLAILNPFYEFLPSPDDEEEPL